MSNEMDRRAAVRLVSGLLGGVAFVGGSALLEACGRRDREAVSLAGAGAFSAGDVALLDEIAETILPATTTPGAKAAGVGTFMAAMVTDTYEPKDQQIFRDGLRKIDDESRSANKVPFAEATPAQRTALLESLDREQHDYMKDRPKDAPSHYFRMMKELTLLGYFTSEIGYTQAMRYIETPGRYDPCLPYTAGEKIWASHA